MQIWFDVINYIPFELNIFNRYYGFLLIQVCWKFRVLFRPDIAPTGTGGESGTESGRDQPF
jgi:hypothetical protein